MTEPGQPGASGMQPEASERLGGGVPESAPATAAHTDSGEGVPFRKIPSDLWLRKRREYPWLADFLCEVSLDEFHDDLHQPGWYAERFGTNRWVIRRLLAARTKELAPTAQPRTGAAQERTPAHGTPLEKSATCEVSRTPTAQPRTGAARSPHGVIETETRDGDREEKTPLPPTDVGAAWLSMQEAFEQYGVQRLRRSKSRDRSLRAVLKEAGPESPSHLVHGYVASQGPPTPSFDPRRYFNPDTVLRAAHRAKYLEAYDRAIEAGQSAPFDFAGATRGPTAPELLEQWEKDNAAARKREEAEGVWN